MANARGIGTAVGGPTNGGSTSSGRTIVPTFPVSSLSFVVPKIAPAPVGKGGGCTIDPKINPACVDRCGGVEL
jgi:hypothetical protein